MPSQTASAAFDIESFVDCARYGEVPEMQEIVKSFLESNAQDVSSGDADTATLRALFTSRSQAGYTALHVASANGEKDVLNYLLPALAPSDLALGTTLDGSTALHWAALNGKTECVQLLLAAGADATIKNDDGRSPVTVAEQQEHFDIVNLLLRTFEPGEDMTGGSVQNETDDQQDDPTIDVEVEVVQEGANKLALE